MNLINNHFLNVYVNNTFFYFNLNGRGFDYIRQWIRKIDLFLKKKLIKLN